MRYSTLVILGLIAQAGLSFSAQAGCVAEMQKKADELVVVSGAKVLEKGLVKKVLEDEDYKQRVLVTPSRQVLASSLKAADPRNILGGYFFGMMGNSFVHMNQSNNPEKSLVPAGVLTVGSAASLGGYSMSMVILDGMDDDATKFVLNEDRLGKDAKFAAGQFAKIFGLREAQRIAIGSAILLEARRKALAKDASDIDLFKLVAGVKYKSKKILSEGQVKVLETLRGYGQNDPPLKAVSLDEKMKFLGFAAAMLREGDAAGADGAIRANEAFLVEAKNCLKVEAAARDAGGTPKEEAGAASAN